MFTQILIPKGMKVNLGEEIDAFPDGEEILHYCLIAGEIRIPNWITKPEIYMNPHIQVKSRGKTLYFLVSDWVMEHQSKMAFQSLGKLRKQGLIVILQGEIHLTQQAKETIADWIDRQTLATVRKNLKAEKKLPRFHYRIPWKRLELYRAGQATKPDLLYWMRPRAKTLDMWRLAEQAGQTKARLNAA